MSIRVPLGEPLDQTLQPIQVFLAKFVPYLPKPLRHKLEVINLAVLALMLPVVDVKHVWVVD